MVTVVDYILGHRTNYKEPHVLEAKHVLLLRTADAIKRHFLITPEIVDGEIWGEFTKPNLPYFNDPPPKGCPEPGPVTIRTPDSTGTATRLQKPLF